MTEQVVHDPLFLGHQVLGGAVLEELGLSDEVSQNGDVSFFIQLKRSERKKERNEWREKERGALRTSKLPYLQRRFTKAVGTSTKEKRSMSKEPE